MHLSFHLLLLVITLPLAVLAKSKLCGENYAACRHTDGSCTTLNPGDGCNEYVFISKCKCDNNVKDIDCGGIC